MTNEEILYIASREMGVKEIDGEEDNERIVEYHRFATRKNDLDTQEDVPWCASFVCWVLEKAGLNSTNSKRARSYEKLGEEVEIQNYLPGDVIVFHRGGYHSGKGHVGFLLTIKTGLAYVLGGNQSDKVGIAKYSLDNMVGIRRVSKNVDNVDSLRKLAVKILNSDDAQSNSRMI
jgi:uncharacterized protein (TIGR02594 family)